MSESTNEFTGATFLDAATCLRRGFAPLDKKRVKPVGKEGDAFKLYYELHGSDKPDARKIVFIMGLNSTCWGWHGQVRYFARQGYQVLAFDNRGVGYSDTPRGPYKTSEMAKDVVDLFDHLGWTSKDHSINVVGVSLGGMISQELGLLIPERIQSIVLTSTTANIVFRLPSLKALNMYVRITTGMVKTKEDLVTLAVKTLYPDSFLDKVGDYEPERGNRDYLEDEFLRRVNTGRPSTAMGRFSQISAGMFHRVKPERLEKLGRSIPAIGVITGNDDNLIYWKESEILKRYLGDVEYRVLQNGGHALPSQFRDEYNLFVESIVESSEGKAKAML
ncbi:alpha/beta-hydrolase [Atractiella rhizophila]|nr:alpha/beta-hydrolase [Atractiella rhizophila]